ncbi:MAG: AI-2E family transporter [Flavobacteriaceae bacterium]|nr:AI-2E family transporter [Flavobacteriaceae bacterium]
MNSISTTNRLLLIIVIPLVFYLLKTLSFIFIPLFFSMFIALLFLPLMRWLGRKKVPQAVALVTVVGIIVGFLFLGGQLVKISINEILSANGDFFVQAEQKLIELIGLFESFLGIDHISEDIVLKHYVSQLQLFDNFGSSINMVGDTITMTLMTAFFVVLFLAGSINLQDVMQTVLFKQKYASVKTFRKVEKDIIKFVWVKFVISLFTGIGFSLACLAFDVSFPIFWGMFAFLINFVQMVGSIISIVALSIFAIVELDPSGTLLAFVLIITGVQVLMGSILEPIFMGKTFSINVITVLVMLMLWGYLWGVPGLIMSIPITVFLKIVLEHFPKTKNIARLMSGSQTSPAAEDQPQAS